MEKNLLNFQKEKNEKKCIKCLIVYWSYNFSKKAFNKFICMKIFYLDF